MNGYKSLLKAASAEQFIEKSRFIVHASPAESREEAEGFIAAVRERYKDATHNVPAMVVGESAQLQWASDDGEPQGTAGAPIVQYLIHEGLTNLALVVTRYFGGIKLGTGGLVRAYTSSAKMGVNAAGICEVRERTKLEIKLDYSLLGKLRALSAGSGIFTIDEVKYEDKLLLALACEKERAAEVKTGLMNLSGGTALLLEESSFFQKIPLDT